MFQDVNRKLIDHPQNSKAYLRVAVFLADSVGLIMLHVVTHFIISSPSETVLTTCRYGYLPFGIM